MSKLKLLVKIAEIEKIGFQVIDKTDDPFVLSLASQKNSTQLKMMVCVID